MTKKQFLIELSDCLEGQISEREIKRQLHYYDEYITYQVSKGKTENQVINEMGDPRWIAKSIIASNDIGSDIPPTEAKEKKRGFRINRIPKWFFLVSIFLCVFFIISFIFFLFRFFIQLFISIIIVLFILWFIKILGKR